MLQPIDLSHIFVADKHEPPQRRQRKSLKDNIVVQVESSHLFDHIFPIILAPKGALEVMLRYHRSSWLEIRTQSKTSVTILAPHYLHMNIITITITVLHPFFTRAPTGFPPKNMMCWGSEEARERRKGVLLMRSSEKQCPLLGRD